MTALDVSKIFQTSKVEVIVEDRIWLITSSKNKQCLKNVTPTNDIIGLQQVSQGIRISQEFSARGIPAVLPIETFDKQNKKLLLFPWQEGRALSGSNITVKHAITVGELLGRLHHIHLSLNDINDSPWYLFADKDWQSLYDKCEQQSFPLLSEFHEVLPQLDTWTTNYHLAIKDFSQSKVISHGDLFPANVIWNQDLSFHVIDWDSAGWINPEIELFGVALNWAGIAEQDFNSEIFASVYAGYESIAQKKFEPTEQLIWASLGSWLKWLKLNIELSLKTSQARFEGEIKSILRALHFLTSHFL